VSLADVADRVPLPPQPESVPWPTDEWPRAAADPAIDALVAAMFDDEDRYGTTYAVMVVRGGEVIAERYGNAIPHWDDPDEPVGASTLLLSWSMAKSILHAAVGLLVGDGVLTLDAPAGVPRWEADPDDPRRAITLDHLLCMRDGLDFAEDYVDAGRSDVIEMLFGAGQHDVEAFAVDRSPAHAPGTRFNYSSGTSNIVSGVVARAVGRGADYERFLRERLFDPIGMRSATPRFDDAGTFIASSYVYACAADYARFGLLYLRDGCWDGTRLLPEGWVDHGRLARSVDEDGALYGAHWWVVRDDVGSFRASGYEGQSILICPTFDLIAVRLGRSTEEQSPALIDWRAAVVDACR
jgi:CubicO group peptidase (beta-lactamase class C family)